MQTRLHRKTPVNGADREVGALVHLHPFLIPAPPKACIQAALRNHLISWLVVINPIPLKLFIAEVLTTLSL